MKEIIIFCPANIITGGVNSLHNLCASLNKNGFNAKMFYVDRNEKIVENPLIKSYNVEEYNGVLDTESQIIIVPETMTYRLSEFKNAIKVVYWLSLKYYFKNPVWKSPFDIKLLRKLISCSSYYGYSKSFFETFKRTLNEYAKGKLNIWSNDFIHLSNSFHVAEYCKSKGAQNTFVIQNPVRDEIYKKEIIPGKRKNIILVGYRTSKFLIFLLKIYLRKYNIIRLKNIPYNELVDLMTESKLFIELGVNPGRDRMPREAGLLGCAVIVGKRDSYTNRQDYNIENQYIVPARFMNFLKIMKLSKEITSNYDFHITKFKNYKEQLINEKQNFDKNVTSVFSEIIK